MKILRCYCNEESFIGGGSANFQVKKSNHRYAIKFEKGLSEIAKIEKVEYRASNTWNGKTSSPRLKEFCVQECALEVLASVFWDYQGLFIIYDLD